jgi:hypothetical protein
MSFVFPLILNMENLVYAGVKAGNAEIYFTHDVALLKSIKKNNLHPEIFI